MSASRALSIKFGTEGFQQAVSEMQRVAKAFDAALAKAQQSVNDANSNLRRGIAAGSQTQIADAEKARSKAARDANQIISNSYRELRVKSETDLNTLRQQAISAYNAIRISGVASARDIDRANQALKDRLGQIDQALEQTSSKSKAMGRNLTEAVQAAKAAMRGADLTFNQAMVKGSPGLAQTAKDARVRATWRKEGAVHEAFGRLNVSSEATINRQKRQLIDSYNAIRQSGVASARDIANAERALNAEFKNLDRTLRGTEGLLGKLSMSAGNGLKNFAGNMVQGIGMSVGFSAINAVTSAAMAPLTLPVTAIQKWADFETQLKAIKVAADGADITPLRREIETLGPAVGKLPSELANVAIELTRAGFSADQTTKLLRGIGNASNATGEDLSTVGNIIRNTIKQFQVSTEDYGKVSDILVSGANKTSAGIDSLGEALTYVGPNAALANQSLTDTVTILGALSDAGLQGSMAGTNFSEALERIKAASAGATTETIVTTRGMKTATQAIDELGVNFRNADGSLRPILDTLPQLRKALAALPQTDQDVILRVLFGAQGGRAINALLIKTDAEINTLRKSIEASGGAADAAGKQMTSGLGGAFKRLQATIEVGFTALGETEAPGLQAATETAEELLTRLLKVDGLFSELNSVSQEFSDYLKKNPELVNELDRQLTELVRTSLYQASQNAKQLLQYFKDNPNAIADSVESLKTFITELGEALKLAQQLGAALTFKFDPLRDTFKSLKNIQEGRATAKRAGFGEEEFDKRFKALEDKIPWYNIAERMKRRNELIEQAIASFSGGSAEQTSFSPGQKILPVKDFQYIGREGSFGALRNYGGHTGEDIVGAPGTPVYAVMGGMVSSLKILDGAVKSYAISVKAADGTIQRYLHVNPVVTPTQRIIAGQQIATVAPKDSLSSGPHLHYDVQRGGNFISPKGYLKGATELSKAKSASSITYKTNTPEEEAKIFGSSSKIDLPKKKAALPNPNGSGTGTSKPLIRVTKTGSKNAQGLEILQMDLVQNGSVKDSILVTSTNQTFTTAAKSKSDSKAPIPEGQYGLDKPEWASGKKGNFSRSFPNKNNAIGSFWLPTPNDTPNNRSAFGIHFDNDLAIRPGSDGCLVLGSKSDILKLQGWMDKSNPNKLIVDYGFGTVADPTKLTKTEIKKDLAAQTNAAQAQRNQYQYLARIAEGESAGGKNLGPNPQTGAYGEYQFTPSSRKLLQNQAPGLDPWSKSKAARDAAALKWIELYGKEKGTDLLALIRKGDFETADKILGKSQFTSLPGGAEQSRIWQDPAMLRKFGSAGKVEGDTYYKQAEDAQNKARELVDKARQRADERRKQAQELERTKLEESQKKALLDYDLQTSKMPEGEAKAARGTQKDALLRQQTAAKEALQVEQTINQLLEERKQKLADLDALKNDPDLKIKSTELKDSGRNITAEIELLRQRKKSLDENLKIENAIAQNNTAAELAQRSKDLSTKVAEVNKTVADLKLQYADTSPETREAQAIAQVNQEFDQHKQVIVEAIKTTLDLITAKQAQGLATEAEIATLEQLKSKYLEVQGVQNKQLKKAGIDISLAERQRALDAQRAAQDIDSQIAEAKATRLDKFGISDEANNLREQAAIAQELLRYKQQLLDLDSTYKDQPALLEKLKQKASELNQLNLTNVKDQFKSLGETIQDSAQAALTGFFTDVFSGTKSVGEAFQAMAKSILASIGQIAAQMLTQSIFKGLSGLFGGGGGRFLGGLFGGGGGGSGFSFTSLPSFHSGGHTGSGGEFLALLQGNEFVLNPTATNFFGAENLNRMNSLSPLPISTPTARNGSSGGGQTININVQSTDVNSFNRSEMQIGQLAAEQLYRAQRRNGS
jgi:TP901 family phage tail tape measure protein